METIETGGDWTETEIARFLKRASVFVAEGLDNDEAEPVVLYRNPEAQW